jgi:PKD repeat protein
LPASAFSGGNVLLDNVPQTLQLEITSVSPSTPSLQKNVFVDGKVILNQGNTYEFAINEERDYAIRIVVEDLERDLKKEIPLTLTVKRPNLIGKLTLTPDSGYEPLSVTLDASQSISTVLGDSIEFFSWDFGDGETKTNLPNGIITHTYKYDYQNEKGTFFPKVVITTRKGEKVELTTEMGILVKKQLVQIDLSSPSHPTQIARVGDKVQFLAEFNGLPKTMQWNFGDGQPPHQCKGRGCSEVSTIYTTAGNYTVKLILEFEDTQPIETVMDIKVM